MVFLMNTDKPILKELNQRKSIRMFAPAEIEQEKLDAMWEAARWAPSSSNKQEWKYYAVMGEARLKLSEALSKGNHYALTAPLLLVVTRDSTIENKFGPREYGMYDVALSAMSLVVEAEHQGLKAHQMAGFDDDVLRRILFIPENELPVVMIAVGYESDEKELDYNTGKPREERPRARKPIEEVVKIVKDL